MLEELDRQIVTLLSTDGRISFTDLGRATGLSVSAVHQRVRRLEQRGVIQSYAARIAPEEVGLPLTAFVSFKPIDPAARMTPRTGLRTSPRSRPAIASPVRRITS